MNYVAFEERLWLTFEGRNKIILMVLILVMVTLLGETLYYCVKKTNFGVSIWTFLMHKPLFSQRLTLKQQIARDIVVIVLLFAFLIYSAIPIYCDTKQQRYVEIEAQYIRNERASEGNLFSYGHVYIEYDGKQLTLELPRDWDDEEFPLGDFYGTVWYSEKSKIILAFIPQ